MSRKYFEILKFEIRETSEKQVDIHLANIEYVAFLVSFKGYFSEFLSCKRFLLMGCSVDIFRIFSFSVDIFTGRIGACTQALNGFLWTVISKRAKN